YWRDLMIVQAAGIEDQSLSVAGSHKPTLQIQSQSFSLDTILAGLDVLVSAKNRMRFTTHGRIVMEMALVRLARLENLIPLSQLAQWVQEGNGAATAARPAAPAASGGVRMEPEKKKVGELPSASNGVSPTSLTQESLPKIWSQVVSESGFAIGGDLR